jgi:hypothetical protein
VNSRPGANDTNIVSFPELAAIRAVDEKQWNVYFAIIPAGYAIFHRFSPRQWRHVYDRDWPEKTWTPPWLVAAKAGVSLFSSCFIPMKVRHPLGQPTAGTL